MVIQSEQIEIDSIIIGARARKDFGDIDELAKSISELGLLQPILCTRIEGDTLLLDGHRRILACQKLGIKTIQAVRFNSYNPAEESHDISKNLQAEHDANMIRKDFTPSEAVWLSDKIKNWIETNKRLEKSNETELKDERGNLLRKEYPQTELLSELQQKKKDSDYERTRDTVAKSVGMSYKTLEKAKAVVESAAENPENADLVAKMDETGKVDPVYKELQAREKGINGKIEAVPGKVVSLIVKMPDGRQKKMGSISNEWFQNKNVLHWIIENVGLGIDEKDIVIHREGNIVKIFDSTNIERLRQGVRYLVDKYSFQGSLMDVIGKEKDHDNLPD